jgi:hypothetical protein
MIQYRVRRRRDRDGPRSPVAPGPPDSRVYDRVAAEKAWSELLSLLKSALG